MRQFWFLIIVTFGIHCSVFSQQDVERGTVKEKPEKQSDSTKQKKPSIKRYQIISIENDTTYVDTTLTIQKDYKFNYLRKDLINLIPFHNIGQTYNTLSYEFSNNQLLPQFGSRARHFNYMELEDINTYRVPTPLTELFYKSTLTQGQILDAFFTVNTSPQFNTSIAYKGMRSIGKYLHSLTSTGNFRFTAAYNTKNRRYYAKGHIVMQDLLNEENGGLKDSQILFFESGDKEFRDRSVLEVNLEDAESILKGKRFYLNQFYKILDTFNSKSHKLKIAHTIYFEDKYFEYNQATASSSIGESITVSNISERETLEHLYNDLEAQYENTLLGVVKFGLSYNNYNYGYDNAVVLNGKTIPNRLLGDIISAHAGYEKSIGKFALKANGAVNVTGNFTGNYLNAEALYQFNKGASIAVNASTETKAPNYNVQLHQSNYISYNWATNFNTIKTRQLGLKLQSEKILNAEVNISNISDYAYFGLNSDNEVKPFQATEAFSYLRLKLEKEIVYGKFALNNTVIYQNTNANKSVFNIPEFITRNTLYYSSRFFKNALFLQTGVTLNYFTSYNMNAYDPVLAEFYTQNKQKLGGYPRLDFFINAKVSQTRIYLKAEHFNSSFTGYNYYAAPNYPYRDFTVRFGIVWNFFL